MGCNCGGKTRTTVTTADVQAMQDAAAAGAKYIVTTPEGKSETFTGYGEAAKFRRSNPGSGMQTVRA